MKRTITHLVVHCTATAHNAKIDDIQAYWRTKLKWRTAGYHKIIKADGEVVTLLPDSKIANGVKGHNKTSLHVSWIGGLHHDNRTMAQRKALAAVLWNWLKTYPDAKICGHTDFLDVHKACPQFDAAAAYNYLHAYIKSVNDFAADEIPEPPRPVANAPTGV